MKTFNGDRRALIKQLPKRLNWVEVGVLRGGFSASILDYTLPKKLVLIDLWKQQPKEVYEDGANVPDDQQEKIFKYVQLRFKAAIANGLVDIRRGYSVEMMRQLAGTPIDCVYLDANHSEPCTLADLREAWKLLRGDGLLLGHDYCHGDGAGNKFGVIPAVDKFIRGTPGIDLAFITKEQYPTYVLAPSVRAVELRIQLLGV